MSSEGAKVSDIAISFFINKISTFLFNFEPLYCLELMLGYVISLDICICVSDEESQSRECTIRMTR